MKIEKVIFTVDQNPHYEPFWASISKHYFTKLNITPKLFVIGENFNPTKYDTTYGEIQFINKIPNIPTIIQALIGKFYFTTTEPETIWKVGDLDLYPLQKHHFINSIEGFDDEAYIHLNPHAYGKNWRNKFEGLAGYYHVAKGKNFESELKFINKSFENVCNEIYYSNNYGIKFHNLEPTAESKLASNDCGWFCCEEMYTGHLLRQSNKLVELPPEKYNRLDRSRFDYNLIDVENNFYIDMHAPRPYELYQHKIEEILLHSMAQDN